MKERIEAAVRDRLLQSSYGVVRRLGCRWHNGRLVLRGPVPSYYLKQVAQEQVQGLEGVEAIENRVIVQHGPSPNRFGVEMLAARAVQSSSSIRAGERKPRSTGC